MKTQILATIAASCLLVGCNRSIENASQKYNELPRPVQVTVRAQAPNAEIANVAKKTRDGMTVYEIEFAEPGKNPKMWVASDGHVVNSDFSQGAPGAIQKLTTGTGEVGTKFSALPEKVQKAVKTRMPNAEIANISRHENDGRVIYEFEFKESGKNPTLKIAEDGTVVQDLQK
ncbi:MAG TPA: PepSY-like domain-containing protein [Verrucomicrobiae bacterium]|jgi:hypothetical protein